MIVSHGCLYMPKPLPSIISTHYSHQATLDRLEEVVYHLSTMTTQTLEMTTKTLEMTVKLDVILDRLFALIPTSFSPNSFPTDAPPPMETLTIELLNTEIDLSSLRSAFITTMDTKKRISLSHTMKLRMLEHAASTSFHSRQPCLSSLSFSPSHSCDGQRIVRSHGLPLCLCQTPSWTRRLRCRPSTSCSIRHRRRRPPPHPPPPPPKPSAPPSSLSPVFNAFLGCSTARVTNPILSLVVSWRGSHTPPVHSDIIIVRSKPAHKQSIFTNVPFFF